MKPLVVRKLKIDLREPLPRHWCGGDAFMTATFNALSMSFPAGEQFFIDSVRKGADALTPDERTQFDADLRGFVGQEATHRHLHGQFNGHLDKAGFVNRWEQRIVRRRKTLEKVDCRLWVAATSASEHFTAMLAEYLLKRQHVFNGTEERLAALWLWHASEEFEHRSTAFDLYRKLDGTESMRRYVFWVVTGHFLSDVLRQTVNNLYHDGTLFKARTWASGLRFWFGKDGLLRQCAGVWRQYLRPDFHPELVGDASLARWLDEHVDLAVPLQPAAEPRVREVAVPA